MYFRQKSTLQLCLHPNISLGENWELRQLVSGLPRTEPDSLTRHLIGLFAQDFALLIRKKSPDVFGHPKLSGHQITKMKFRT